MLLLYDYIRFNILPRSDFRHEATSRARGRRWHVRDDNSTVDDQPLPEQGVFLIELMGYVQFFTIVASIGCQEVECYFQIAVHMRKLAECVEGRIYYSLVLFSTV